MKSHELWPAYTTDLILEGLLALYDATREVRFLDYVLKVWEFRGPPRNSLLIGNVYFTCLHAETHQRTGDPRFVDGLVDVAGEWRDTAPRTPEGAIAHRKDPRGAILLDMLAGYAPLMAAAGVLSGDESFFDECARQCRLYCDILRDPDTGLWHHARGWRETGVLSPAGWCRGQGWALRALVKSLAQVPATCAAHDLLLNLLRELTADLIRYQQPSGMWHQLVDEPEAYPETSGTGFIISMLQVADRDGWIDAKPAIMRGVEALAGFVSAEGIVHNGCPETPPLAARGDYQQRGPTDDDPHAVAALLMALAGMKQ